MARQSTTPVPYQRTTRHDRVTGMTSGRAGEMVPVDFFPVLRGDSASGRWQGRVDLAEMPKPLQNAVYVNAQAWFVPKPAFPQFSGYDEFMHSYHGEQIKALGQSDRTPPAFFTPPSAVSGAVADSEVYRTLGLHYREGAGGNVDILDAVSLIWNFRAAAHSSRIPRRPYHSEDPAVSGSIPPAFWPSGKLANVVPDYERALILGQLDLDVLAGQLPIEGLYAGTDQTSGGVAKMTTPEAEAEYGSRRGAGTTATFSMLRTVASSGTGQYWKSIFADMAGQNITTSLADIDKARTLQSFAKLRTTLAGNDATGFDNDDAIVAELMQGFSVPKEQFKRPWLLDSQRIPFGMVERHATDAANLDQSVTKGGANISLSLNVPAQDVGGVVVIILEVVPERLHERQGDPFLQVDDVSDFPDALRDVLRPEPVDIVPNWRVDARHTTPDALYGYEPMNAKWVRDFTRLGGIYYQEDPLNPFRESRAGIWQTDVVDPSFTAQHWVCPEDFPHDVFADTLAPAFEVAFRHNVAIRGLTQIGDVLSENNDEYAETQEESGDAV